MSMEASRVWTQRLNPLVGDTFVTTRRLPILTLVEDTSPGVHDTFMAACDCHRYELARRARLSPQLPRQHVRGHARTGRRTAGADPRLLQYFHEYRGEAGRPLTIDRPAVSKPGDYVTLRADMDCFVAFSACPQDIVQIQGETGVPMPAHYVILEDGFPDLPVLPSLGTVSALTVWHINCFLSEQFKPKSVRSDSNDYYSCIACRIF